MYLSIIIPCCNSQKFIKLCLNSVYSQKVNLNLFEVILVDDASKDDTKKIVKKFKVNKNLKTFYNKKNKGVSVTRNLGIKKATGKYILFLDSDDELINNSIKEIINFIKKGKNTDIAVLRNKNIDQSRNVKDFNEIFNSKRKKIILDIIQNSNKFRATCWNFLVRREFLKKEKIKFKNFTIFEDQLFVSRLICSAKSFEIIEKTIYNRRLSEPQSLSKLVGYSTAKNCLKISNEIDKLFFFYKKKNIEKIGKLKKFLKSRILFLNNLFLENLLICKNNQMRFFSSIIYNYRKKNRYIKSLNLMSQKFTGDRGKIEKELIKYKESKIEQFLKNINLEDTHIIFCAWYYSEIIMRICEKKNIKIKYILDNNLKYNNKMIFNIKILNPNKAKKYLNNKTKILICNKNKIYIRQIFQQLKKIGIKNTNITKVTI